MSKNIYLTDIDRERLEDVIRVYKLNALSEKHVLSLEDELTEAHIISYDEMPNSIVTMNTRLKVKNLESGDSMELTLVYPKNADIRENRISILAPLGVALIGEQVGDTVAVRLPSGSQDTYIIEEILYQPEEAGDFDQ